MQTTTTIRQQHNCYTNSDSPVCYKASYDGGSLLLRKFTNCVVCRQPIEVTEGVLHDIDFRVEKGEKITVILTIRSREKPITVELPLTVGQS